MKIFEKVSINFFLRETESIFIAGWNSNWSATWIVTYESKYYSRLEIFNVINGVPVWNCHTPCQGYKCCKVFFLWQAVKVPTKSMWFWIIGVCLSNSLIWVHENGIKFCWQFSPVRTPKFFKGYFLEQKMTRELL